MAVMVSGIPDKLEVSKLNILRTVPERMLNLNGQASGVGSDHFAIHPVASPRMKFDPQQAYGISLRQSRGCRITGIESTFNDQVLWIRALQKSRLSANQRCPRVTPAINRADHNKGKLAVKVAVLIRHEVANDLAAELLHSFRHTNRVLQHDFALVKWRWARCDVLIHWRNPLE